MPTLLTIWGIMVTLQGPGTRSLYAVTLTTLTIYTLHSHYSRIGKSYAGLATVRAFLGLHVIEGPMFPGIVLYLSGFYTSKELSLRYVSCRTYSGVDPYDESSRIALFFSAASVRYEIWTLESESDIFGTEVHLLALGRLFWVACCRNREHGWHWWKTWMGLDLHLVRFYNVFILSFQSSPTSTGRIVYSSHGPP
jgi:hypothetical protein